MFQLPIPNKRITWFFSIFFTILFLFVYYRFDSMGYGLFKKSLEKFFVTCNGSIEDVLEYKIMVPVYKNFEELNFLYFQVKNISSNVIKSLEIDVYDSEKHLLASKPIEEELSDSGQLLFEMLESDNYENIGKKIIYDLQPGSETSKKIQIYGKPFPRISFEIEFLEEDTLYFFTTDMGLYVHENRNKTIKMELLPFLLLSPFSTAIFPVAILFLGYLFEAMLLDKKYEFDELRFFTRNIFHSIFYLLHKIKVRFRKIRKIAIPMDEDNSKKELMNNKEIQVIWQFIGVYFFSIIILYTLFSWYIISFEYLSPLLIVLSLIGILLITRILYSNYKKNSL